MTRKTTLTFYRWHDLPVTITYERDDGGYADVSSVNGLPAACLRDAFVQAVENELNGARRLHETPDDRGDREYHEAKEEGRTR